MMHFRVKLKLNHTHLVVKGLTRQLTPPAPVYPTQLSKFPVLYTGLFVKKGQALVNRQPDIALHLMTRCNSCSTSTSRTWCNTCGANTSRAWCNTCSATTSRTWCNTCGGKTSRAWCNTCGANTSRAWCNTCSANTSRAWCNTCGATTSRTWCNTCGANTIRSPSSDNRLATANCVPTCIALVCHTQSTACVRHIAHVKHIAHVRHCLCETHTHCERYTANVRCTLPCETRTLPMWDTHTLPRSQVRLQKSSGTLKRPSCRQPTNFTNTPSSQTSKDNNLECRREKRWGCSRFGFDTAQNVLPN